MQFLPDIPAESDELKTHEPITRTLLQLINSKYPGVFVIGLFGGWGSGKTSITKWLKNLVLNKHKDDLAFAEVDAWQSGDDFFGASFVRALAKSCLNNEKKRIALKKISTKHSDRTVSPNLEGGTWIIFLILIVFILLITASISLHYKLDNSFPWVSLATLTFTGFIVIGVQLYTRYYAIRVDSYEDDISFEQADHFKSILIEDVLPNIRQETCCVVIDNIDRLEPDEAIKVLRKLKTFIVDEETIATSNTKLVLVVPVDNKVLKSHIGTVYGTESSTKRDGSEFLKKFFTISLRIPTTIRTDLFQYTIDLLKQIYVDSTLPDDLTDVAFIFNRAANRNPRQVKTLLNDFVALNILLSENNPIEEIQSKLLNNPVWLAFHICSYSIYENSDFPDSIGAFKEISEDSDSTDLLTSFLTSTEHLWESIPEDAWFWLRHHKLSDNALAFPSFDTMYDFAAERNTKQLWKLLSKYEEEKQREILNRLHIQAKPDQNTLFNLVESIISMVELGLKQENIPQGLFSRINSIANGQNGHRIISKNLAFFDTKLTSYTLIGIFAYITKYLEYDLEEGQTSVEFKLDDRDKDSQDFLEFLEVFLERNPQIDNELLPHFQEALEWGAALHSPIASILFKNPHLSTYKISGSLGVRLAQDPSITNTKISHSYFENKILFLTEFATRLIPILVEKIKAAKGASISYKHELYKNGAIAISGVDPHDIHDFPDYLTTLLSHLVEHINTRATIEEKLSAILLVLACEANSDSNSNIINQAKEILSQNFPKVLVDTDEDLLQEYVIDFPELFGLIDNNQLVVVGELNQSLYSLILNQYPNKWEDGLLKPLIEDNFNMASEWLEESRSIEEKVVIFKIVTELCEEYGYDPNYDYYALLEDINFGRNRNDVKQVTYSHYDNFLADNDITIVENIETFTRIIKSIRISPSKSQRELVENKIKSISLEGFEGEVKILRKVLKGEFK